MLKLKIHGHVQGVFFRANTQRQAEKLGLKGYVKNTDDGCVEVEAAGPREKLEELLAWCRKGPPGARIDNIDISWSGTDKLFSGFRIAY